MPRNPPTITRLAKGLIGIKGGPVAWRKHGFEIELYTSGPYKGRHFLTSHYADEYNSDKALQASVRRTLTKEYPNVDWADFNSILRHTE